MKFGIISPGNHFINRIYPAMKKTKSQISAVYSRRGTFSNQIAEETRLLVTSDLEEFLKGDFEAVYISSPNSLHYADANACLKAGKHVLLEKPMALRSTDADKLVSLAESTGMRLAVGFHLRFHPALIEIRDMITSGEIDLPGISYISAEWGGLRDRHGMEGTWWGEEKMAGGGSLVGTGVHVLDSLNYVTGEPPREITAMRFPDIVLEYTTSILIRYDHFPACATVSGGVAYPENSLRIITDEGTVEATEVYGTEIGGSLLKNGKVVRKYPRRSIYEEEIRGFVDYVDGKESRIATAEDGALVTRELEGVHLSSQNRITVRL